ncbi:MAG TPA: malate synthase [Clostridia bacterium]|nr:malate synthase [Clostridia bacterium]
MSIINKQVTHEIFGKGNVVKYDDAYIKIKFASGDKKFVFPDAFESYLTLVDKRAANLVNKKLEEQEKERREEALRLKEQEALERKKRLLLEQEQRLRDRKIHPSSQSVFWCRPEEQEKIFAEWEVFAGAIKSGERKGEPRRYARMTQNSACLITRRDTDMKEEDRRITGIFMADRGFDGRKCEDGYIPAHPNYRIHLSEAESKRMLFWNYYSDERYPQRMIWNSGRQRYFKNVLTAQILRDIVSLRKEQKDEESGQHFLEYFCRHNLIDIEDLPEPSGTLMRG